MSWSLSLDRAPRSRRPTSYSDTTRYKEPTNEEDNLSKKKRGRPPRVNGQEIISDGAPPPKRRGRPPKFPRPQTPNNNNSQKTSEDQSKITKYKSTKKYESSSSSQSKSSESDIDDNEYYSVDYAYEYEYESENTVKEEKPQHFPFATISNQNSINQIDINIQPKPAKPPTQTKSSLFPLRTVKKLSKAKSKPTNDTSLPKNDNEFYIIQEIIGQRDNFLSPKNTPNQYFVKFLDMPYNYCRWLTSSQITKYEGGDAALKKFLTKSETSKLIHSISIPRLLIFSDTEILTQWFEVDRIFGESITAPTAAASSINPNSSQAEETKNIYEYLVKWKELDYDSFSVESLDHFRNRHAICEYKSRIVRKNPKKIPTRWVHPNILQLIKVTQLPVSKNGEVFRQFQLDGLNWLIECWFMRRFSIFGDMTREGKMPELICMLNFLSQQFQINGPFLVLCSENQILSWKEHFENWSSLNVVLLAGNSSSRQITIDHEIEVRDDHGRLVPDYVRFDVLLTSYEVFLSTSQSLSEIDWRYVIADDGYKMRNSRGRIRNSLKQLKYEHITLSMEWEMLKPKNDYQIYFLMNFINPQGFNNFNEFVNTFVPYEGEKMVKLNKIVQPFLMCRDVEKIKESMKQKEETVIIVQPSNLQKRLYIEAVKNKTEILMKPITDQADVPLTQLITLLRQIVDHPILALSQSSNENEINDIQTDLVNSCGKMYFVDLLLKEVVPKKKRVMIFTQFVRVLDIFELYLSQNELPFERIDTMTTADDRIEIISRYLSSETSIFLFSSKPGSYQIDVNMFDIVVVYDKDSYIFHSEMRGTLYRLVTNGSFEMNRSGKNETVTSFDEQTLLYLTHTEFRLIDAEDIELVLRDTIKPMFEKSDDKITAFYTKSLSEILSTCEKTSDMYKDDNTAIVDYNKQKKFWNELLKPPQQPKKDNAAASPDQVTRVKQLINSLTDHGFRGGIDQLDLLKCALTLAPPENAKSLNYLNELVGDNSSNTPVHRFGVFAFLIDKLASKMFDNVVFFARLKRALFYATRDDLNWPPISPSAASLSSTSSASSSSPSKETQALWKDFNALDEYTLMYTLDQVGIKQLASAFEKAKELKFKQIEKRVTSIIESIERQYSVSGGFPQISRQISKNENEYGGSDLEDDEAENENIFVPLSPSEWSAKHPNIVVRNVLNDDEVIRVFVTISDFGIPLESGSYFRADIVKFATIADISHVSMNAIEECIHSIIDVSLTFLRSAPSAGSDEFGKYDRILRGSQFDREKYLNVILVCRLMNKVYSFLNDRGVLVSKSEPNDQLLSKMIDVFEKANISANFDINKTARLFACLVLFGVNNTARWSADGGLEDFPATSEARLRFASRVIDSVCSSKVVRSTTNLHIFNFGKIVEDADNSASSSSSSSSSSSVSSSSFSGKQCPYPVGFVSTRLLPRSVEELPAERWYRCEIQSVLFVPLFVVSYASDDASKEGGDGAMEFVETTPFEAWKLNLGSLIGYENAEEVLKRIKVSGEWLFGLTHPDVINVIQDMDKKSSLGRKNQDESQTENSDEA